MKKKTGIWLFMTLILLLSACSLEPNVEKSYKQEEPLFANIVIPKTFSATEPSVFEVVLTQGGKQVENADFVHFEIWKQDGSLNYGMEQANEVGKGIYTISKIMESDGLYYIKVHASNADSTIMPQKQFIVGDLSKTELEFLQNGPQNKEMSEGHHH